VIPETLGRRAGAAGPVVAGEILQEIQHLRQTMTEWAAQLAGRLTNNVLAVATAAFPADGSPIALEYNVAAGCIEVNPLGTNPVTVVAAGPQTVAPATGQGVFVVRGTAATVGAPQTVPVASRTITLYGTPGDLVSYAVYTAAITPTS
jgi:hypothetical protein